jgi:hypothetical protein
MKAQKECRGIALLSPTLGAIDSLQLMNEELFFTRVHYVFTYTSAFA